MTPRQASAGDQAACGLTHLLQATQVVQLFKVSQLIDDSLLVRKEAWQVAGYSALNRSHISLQSLNLAWIVALHVGCQAEQAQRSLNRYKIRDRALVLVEVKCPQRSLLTANHQVPNVDDALHVACDQEFVLNKTHCADFLLVSHHLLYRNVSQLVRIHI